MQFTSEGAGFTKSRIEEILNALKYEVGYKAIIDRYKMYLEMYINPVLNIQQYLYIESKMSDGLGTKVIQAYVENPKATRKELAEKFDMPQSTFNNRINILISFGVLKKVEGTRKIILNIPFAEEEVEKLYSEYLQQKEFYENDTVNNRNAKIVSGLKDILDS